jgi:hypothetical protein
MDDLNISLRAIYFYLEGVKAYHKKDKFGLVEVIHTMEDERIEKTALITEKGLALCAGAGGMSDAPNQLDVDQAYVMELQLKGFLAGLEDHEVEAEKFLKQAAMLEENVSYSYGPPPIVKPSPELYGEWLLQASRPEEALVQFEKALDKGPKRVLSLKGKLQAATLLNDDIKAREADDLLQKIQQQADEEAVAQMKDLQYTLL